MDRRGLKYYSIHGMLNLVTNLARPRLPSYFEVAEPLRPDTKVLEGNFRVDSSSLRPLGLRLLVGDGIVVHKCLSYGDLRLLLKDPAGSRGPTYVLFTRQYRVFKEKFGGETIWRLVRLVLMAKLLSKHRHTFIHASGVSINGEAFLFAGWSDVGKTSTAVALVGIGRGSIAYISGDATVIGPRGSVLAWPGCTGRTIARPFERIPFLRGLAVRKKVGTLRGAPIEPRSEVSSLFILESGPIKRGERLEPEEALRKLALSTDMSFDFSSNLLLLAYSYIDSSFDLRELKARHLGLLRELISRAECYRLVSPGPKGFVELAQKYLL